MGNRHDMQLELQSILNTAIAESGLDDFGDDGLTDRVGAVIDAYRAASLSPKDQLTAADTILDVLVTRLRLRADRQIYPEIAEEVVERPVIVGGFPRSGTTLLYSLLAADPQARSPFWWDALHPSPPPGLSPAHDPLRRQIAQREVLEFLQVVPIKPAHNFFVNGADMILECYMLWGLDFRSLAPFLFFRPPVQPTVDPGSASMDLSANMADTYRFEKQLLQALQWRRKTGHWVLKDPTHHFYLPELFEVFPDATVVWPHRDPVRIFASVVELISLMSGGVARQTLDRREVAKALLPIFRNGLNRVINHPIIDSPKVIHVSYGDMTKDSIALARQIYGRMDRDFTPEIERNIQAYRENPNNRADLYGKFTYTLEATGFAEGELREAFADYISHFDIPVDKA